MTQEYKTAPSIAHNVKAGTRVRFFTNDTPELVISNEQVWRHRSLVNKITLEGGHSRTLKASAPVSVVLEGGSK